MRQRLTRRTEKAARQVLSAGIFSSGLLVVLFLARPVEEPAMNGELVLYVSLLVAAFVGFGGRASLSLRDSTDNVLILGNSWLAGQLQSELTVINESDGRRLQPDILDPCRVEEVAERLQQLILNGGISDIVLTDPSIGTREELTALLIECKFRGIRISRAPEFYEGFHKKVWLEALRPEAFVYSDALYLSRRYLVLKRALDVCFAVAVLALTLPLLLLIAAAIKLESSGPVLFRQERVGRFGATMMLYKFRSMRDNAEKDTGPVWAQENDDRVTRVGRFLRRTHLDELPQVFNVLKNDLSFVGPRPERECFIRTLKEQVPYYRLREYIRPGITGWAQVNLAYGDSVKLSAEKLRYDLYYAKHVSLGFDLKVLFQTVLHVVLGRGR